MIQDGIVLAEARHAAGQGLPAALPLLVAELIAATGAPDMVAAIVGPGSFTGLRAGLSVAQGISLGAGIAAIGVTVAEALADSLPALGTRTLWVAMQGRRGHIFLDRGGDLATFPLDALPKTRDRIAVAGDAANETAASLAARGTDIMLTSARRPVPRHVALVALRRAAGELAPLAAVPLYVEAPQARLPAGGLRPAPQGGTRSSTQ
jgi:tRNA A37 threonylcarbamoyladenosine modification protein TsaB